MNLNFEKFVYNQSKSIVIDDEPKVSSSKGMLTRKPSKGNNEQALKIPAYRVEMYRKEIEKQNMKKQGVKDAETTT